MEVGAGGTACAPDEADDLLLVDPTSGTDPRLEAAHVIVMAEVPVRVPDHHEVSPSSVPSHLLDRSVADGPDGRSGGGAEITPFVLGGEAKTGWRLMPKEEVTS